MSGTPVKQGAIVMPDGRSDPDTNKISEIAEILAAGLTRLEAWKSSSKSEEFGESSLHFTPDQSGDAPSSWGFP
jgi:hypothetical protein